MKNGEPYKQQTHLHFQMLAGKYFLSFYACLPKGGLNSKMRIAGNKITFKQYRYDTCHMYGTKCCYLPTYLLNSS